MQFDRENIPRLKIDRSIKLLLIPGLVIQWFIYMNPDKGIRGVAASTRHARSPIMTYVYSAGFYVALIFVSFTTIVDASK